MKWRGFGLLFALVALFVWFNHYDKDKGVERGLIDLEPSIQARRDFRQGNISFLEVFQLTNKEEGPLGKWIVPGEDKIGQDILNQYTERNRLDISFNFRLNEEQDSIARRAHKFALSYNLEMFDQIRTTMLHNTEQNQ
ncbi:MAG: hypothetical protein JW837_14170 [Sedimentisphaerales bacterium]|nr:hypothetical protein [Sedimentisphaerales bacterium]